MSRPSWDEYFISLAKTVATRSTCTRAQVGALLVRDRNILSTGYNGSVRGLLHCPPGCELENGHCVRTVHAEANAIAHAARSGAKVEGSTLYVTHYPCWPCFKLVSNAGVRVIVFNQRYGEDTRVDEAAWALGITLRCQP